MEENDAIGIDQKTMLMNKGLGLVMVIVGIYGLIYAYNLITKK